MFVNYQAWIDGIRATLDVDKDEYSDALIGQFLHMGEDTLNRVVRTRLTEAIDTLVIAEDSGGIASLPTDYQELRSAHVKSTGEYIQPVAPSEFYDALASLGGVDSAVHSNIKYCMIIGTKIHFMPYGLGQTVEIVYYKKIPHLAAGSQETSDFTTHYSDALLYAACLSAAPYMIDDVRLPMWKQELDRIISDVNKVEQNEHYGNAPVKRRLQVFG
jgi:hypothetical protein